MSAGKPVLAGYGQYTDIVRKIGGRWFMAERRGVAFW